MKATYKVWLEMSAREAEEGWNPELDPEFCDEPYWARLRAILASLDSQGQNYTISFDNDDGRDYALVEAMPPAAQLSLEDQNVAIP